MKFYIWVFTVILTASVCQAREIQYSCTSYHDQSQDLQFTLDTQTQKVSGEYRGQVFDGVSTDKVKPNINVPFATESGHKFELYFDVNSHIGSVYAMKDLRVIFQGYCH